MNKWKRLSQLSVFALILIAFVVFLILLNGQSAWIFIVLYWAVLTLKNFFDAMSM